MLLEEKLREDARHANSATKSILKALVAEMERIKQDTGHSLSDNTIYKIIREFVEHNHKTIDLLKHNDGSESRVNELYIENNILEGYLPAKSGL